MAEMELFTLYWDALCRYDTGLCKERQALVTELSKLRTVEDVKLHERDRAV